MGPHCPHSCIHSEVSSAPRLSAVLRREALRGPVARGSLHRVWDGYLVLVSWGHHSGAPHAERLETAGVRLTAWGPEV